MGGFRASPYIGVTGLFFAGLGGYLLMQSFAYYATGAWSAGNDAGVLGMLFLPCGAIVAVAVFWVTLLDRRAIAQPSRIA